MTNDQCTVIRPVIVVHGGAGIIPDAASVVTPFGQRSDTVGAVALDRDGNLAAGTSTGGRRFKRPGRVGDVPLPGCGFYADNLLGAASSTGEGEAIARIVMAKRAVDALAGRVHPQAAADEAINYLGNYSASG